MAPSTDATNAYELAIYITAGLMLVNAIIPLVTRPPDSPREEAEPGRPDRAQKDGNGGRVILLDASSPPRHKMQRLNEQPA